MLGFGVINNKVVPNDISKSSLKAEGIRKKECTNPGFILSYVIFLSSVSSISWFSFSQCNIAYFLNGIDSWGNICGTNLGTALQIDGFEEYAKDKSDFSYLRRIACNGTDIRICMKDCSPTTPSNTSFCASLLEQNGYNDNQVAVSYCADECGERNETGQTRSILNRCITTELIHSYYQLIPGFLEFLHYAMEDIKNCLAMGGGIFSIMFFGCIIMNFVFLLYPKQAMLLCFATSVFSTVSATVYSALSILHSSPKHINEWRTEAIPLILNSTLSHYCFISLLSAFGLVINFIGIVWTIKSRKQIIGLWEISSKLMKSNPQLLSQPVLSLLVIVIATAYFLVIMLLLLGCRTINVSSIKNTVNLEQSDFTWLLLPAALTFIWFIDLIKKGQNTILAGAASKWYFTRRFNLTFYPMSAVLKYNLGGIAAITVSNIFTKCKDSCPGYQSHISSFANISLGVYGRIQQTFLDENRDDKYSTPLTKACMAIHFALQAWKIGLIQISTVAFTVLTSQTSMFTSLIPIILNAFISWKVTNLFIDGLEAIILGLALSAYEDCLRNETADVPKFSDSIVACLFARNTESPDKVSSRITNSSDSETSSKSAYTLSIQSKLDLSQTRSKSEDYETASSDSKYSDGTTYGRTGWKKQVGSDEEFKSSSGGDKRGIKTIKTVKHNSSVESWNIDWW